MNVMLTCYLGIFIGVNFHHLQLLLELGYFTRSTIETSFGSGLQPVSVKNLLIQATDPDSNSSKLLNCCLISL